MSRAFCQFLSNAKQYLLTVCFPFFQDSTIPDHNPNCPLRLFCLLVLCAMKAQLYSVCVSVRKRVRTCVFVCVCVCVSADKASLCSPHVSTLPCGQGFIVLTTCVSTLPCGQGREGKGTQRTREGKAEQGNGQGKGSQSKARGKGRPKVVHKGEM